MFDSKALTKKEFWQELFPEFSIGKKDLTQVKQFEANENEVFDEQLLSEGYIKLENGSKCSQEHQYAELISKLVDNDLLPVFCLIYDEFWCLQAQFKKLLSKYLGDEYLLLPAAWAWHLDRAKNEAGWGPHRDRGFKSLDENGNPLFLTLWIPLSEASPDNGCMYLVPANLDKEYGTENDSNRNFSLNSIRALPAKNGDALIWNQAILHWGGMANPRAKENRISIGFEFQSSEIPAAKDLMLNPHEIPSFELKLQLIARQIIQYMHMYSFDQSLIDFAKGVLTSSGVDLIKFIEDNSN